MAFEKWVKWTAACACLAALAAGSAEGQQRHSGGERALSEVLTGRSPGRPVNCISLRAVRSSLIIDRTAIVYDVGGTLYVNRPRSGASSLDDDDVLITRTTGSQLCRLDMVRLVDRGSRVQSGSVSLGQFVPYARPRPTRR
jgi:hypothetical protein